MEADILEASSEKEEKQMIQKYHMWEWNFLHSTEEGGPSKAERAAKERVAHMLGKILRSTNNEE